MVDGGMRGLVGCVPAVLVVDMAFVAGSFAADGGNNRWYTSWAVWESLAAKIEAVEATMRRLTAGDLVRCETSGWLGLWD